MCTWSRGGVPGLGGVPGPGGCTWSWGGVPDPGGVADSGGCVPGPRGCTWSWGGVPGQVLPPCGQTHACKNITFTTSLRTVNMQNTDNTVTYTMQRPRVQIVSQW